MTITTTTDLAAYINTVVNPNIQKTFYDDAEFLPLLTNDEYKGDTAQRWPFKYSGNGSSTLTSEGQAPPTPGKSAKVRGAASFQTIQTTVEVTGEAQSAMKDAIINDALAEGIDDAIAAHAKKEDDYAQQEIIDAIDDDTTIYGLTRATYNLTSEVVAGGSANLSEAMLGDLYQGVTTPNRNVKPSELVMFSAHDQIRRYTEFVGAAYGEINRNVNLNGESFDLGRMANGVNYQKIPWLQIGNMTNTLIFMSRLTDMRRQYKQTPIVMGLGKEGYFDKMLVVSEIAVYHLNPNDAGRIEAVLAY